MKTIAINNTNKLTTRPSRSSDGCSHTSDGKTLKMRLHKRLGLSNVKFTEKALEILDYKKESVPNKIFTIQNIGHIESVEAEDALIRMISKKDSRFSYPALKALSLSGTEKSYKTLSKVRSLPFKSLERQKDFTLLMIGYRLQLAGTDKILNRLLKDAQGTKKIEEFKMKFQSMDTDAISTVLKQSSNTKFGLSLSRKKAFEIKAGGQVFYFCFSDKFDDPTKWQKVLKTNQIVGQLLKKEPNTSYVSKQYIALATPMKDHAQLSIFRKNGELFMLAKVMYDHKNNSFTISNSKVGRTKDTGSTQFNADENKFVAMNLSYIRYNKKRKTEIIKRRNSS